IVLFSQAADGTVDPTRLDHIPGLEALEDADLLVLFARWRNLPDAQMAMIAAYFESGRPVVGFRTATHAFKFPAGNDWAAWNETKTAALVGQRWITHHGHFSDGDAPLTRVQRAENAESPILNGVKTPIEAYSWLYHVTGGGDSLAPGCTPLLIGETLRSKHLMNGRGARYPGVQPVAWTKTNPFSPAGAVPGRVFFTTLGHPYDFKRPAVRRLAVQGVLWALGREAEIPKDGVNADAVAPYAPTNSGFGAARIGRTPAEVLDEAGLSLKPARR
ncbi:MAG: ThuA domain-containing protein, partial [Planctomycetota bacterium]